MTNTAPTVATTTKPRAWYEPRREAASLLDPMGDEVGLELLTEGVRAMTVDPVRYDISVPIEEVTAGETSWAMRAAGVVMALLTRTGCGG